MKPRLYQAQCVLFSLLLALLSACDSGSSQSSDMRKYFPLEKGLIWEYKHELALTGDEPVISTFHIENLGEKVFRDKRYWVRRTSHGTDYYLGEDKTGLFRYGKRTIVENEPRLDASPRMVLPLPVPNKVGKAWSVLTQSYTLHRVLPNYEPPHENIAHFHMTYSVVGLDEDVSVPAGQFKHCLLIEGQAQIDQFAGANEGTGEIEITTREWYAPHVGMVKMERIEPLDGSVFKGGK
ncbi:MAG: Unknown protein, partial [uncultured Thiotrichaceae bacterium]